MVANKNVQKSPKQVVKISWLRWFFISCAKLAFALSFALALFIIYLDAKVQKTFEGQRWQVPAQIYGQIEHLRLGEQKNIAQLASALQLNGYKKVARVNAPSQFSQSATRLIVYRRAFDFPNAEVGESHDAVKLIIDFEQDKISQLFIENQPVAALKLEPVLLARLVPDNKEDRILMALEGMPTLLLDTLLLIEDRDFYHHQGISPLGILRALYSNLLAGRTVQGGSTLTQQLVKNMFLTREKTLTRKFKEALMALIIEVRYSKDQLLEAYINEVYLGQHYANGIYGFGLAAKFYFGKSVEQLSHEQIALLVAQVKGPSYYDPWRHPERAKTRRDLILRLMFEQNFLSVREFEQAVTEPLTVRSQRRFKNQNYPAYLQLVKSELSQQLSTRQQKSGIRVFTGFSQVSQQLLEQSVARQLVTLEQQNQQSDLQAAMIVTDIASAEVRALVGGKQSGYAGFNRALHVNRPIGSLIKPVIYSAALERYEQYNLATVLDDKPITLKSGQGKSWQPKNYDGKYRGQVPLIDGLVKSLNIPTVNLGMSLGLDNVANAMYSLGHQKEIVTRPSMLLGAINMSPWQVNQMYLPIANRGYSLKAHAVNLVVSKNGSTLWQFEEKPEQILSTNAAYLVDYALSEVTKSGTARSLSWRNSGAELAGKTGTSNDLRDSWFIGYDDKYIVTTWLGKDDNAPTGLTGSSGALVLFSDYMKKQGVTNKIPIKPDAIALTLFEQQTGNAVTSECDDTITYPAISLGIRLQTKCLKEKQDSRSWLEKLFGD
ncbi:MAG: penicillin-binding protein 1B [Colwellia sp.]|nr:penicillin-binding protein 1B [Colwellia sp.]MCW8865324.1 penicillin-binding protein 1B [Colwellia sp.]MCW9080345.1 penicillin-binding protein 1B [Colwellia sp.]